MWGVRFPDLPGCVAQAETAEKALAQASAALREVMTYKRGQGVEIPKASGLAKILDSGEVGPWRGNGPYRACAEKRPSRG
jgi:predicted RNase H-like HicB family nuclease